MSLARGGGLVGYRQTVPRAELYAVIQILKLRQTGSTTRIGVDCKYVIKESRLSHLTVAARSNADLWAEYHDLVRVKCLTVALFKVKAHMSVDDVISGVIAPQDFVGNAAGDAFAKRGAHSGPFLIA